MMTTQQAARLIRDAYAAALSGDTETAGELVARVAQDSTNARLFGMCGAIAAPAVDAYRVLLDGRVPDRTKGERYYVLHLRPALNRVRGGEMADPAHRFSDRFLTAFLNRDYANEAALFGAALAGPREHFPQCASQMFGDVAGLCALAGIDMTRRSR